MRISDWSSDVCSSDLSASAQSLSEQARQLADLVGFFRTGGATPARKAAVQTARTTASVTPLRKPAAKPAAALKKTEIGRPSLGKEGVSTCRIRWSPYH